jgi:transcriptional regulator with XRE-family HTH domain
VENVGNRIRKFRRCRKVTQEILSQRVGVNRSLISKIERDILPVLCRHWQNSPTLSA